MLSSLPYNIINLVEGIFDSSIHYSLLISSPLHAYTYLNRPNRNTISLTRFRHIKKTLQIIKYNPVGYCSRFLISCMVWLSCVTLKLTLVWPKIFCRPIIMKLCYVGRGHSIEHTVWIWPRSDVTVKVTVKDTQQQQRWDSKPVLTEPQLPVEARPHWASRLGLLGSCRPGLTEPLLSRRQTRPARLQRPPYLLHLRARTTTVEPLKWSSKSVRVCWSTIVVLNVGTCLLIH